MIRIILLLELKPFQLNSCILFFLPEFDVDLLLFSTDDFWREATILSKLRHPNVVDFYGVVPDALGTVTEFMVNGSLRNVLLTKHR